MANYIDYDEDDALNQEREAARADAEAYIDAKREAMQDEVYDCYERCPTHGEIISNGMFDGVCGKCEAEAEDAYYDGLRLTFRENLARAKDFLRLGAMENGHWYLSDACFFASEALRGASSDGQERLARALLNAIKKEQGSGGF